MMSIDSEAPMPGPTRRIALVYDARSAYDLKVMAGVAVVSAGEPSPAFLQRVHRRAKHAEGSAAGPHASMARRRHHRRRRRSRGGLLRRAVPPADGRVRVRELRDHPGAGDPVLPHEQQGHRACGRRPPAGARLPVLRVLRLRTGAHHRLVSGARVRVRRIRETAGRLVRRLSRPPRPAHEWAATEHGLSEWLWRLPKPVGVMAAHDDLGRHVLEACRACDLRVPQEVSVIGVDNNELLVSPEHARLEQRRTGGARAGLPGGDAAGRAHPQGARPRQGHFTVDPVTVVTRCSTDVLAIADAKVAQAMTFIQGARVREHQGAPGGRLGCDLAVRPGEAIRVGAGIHHPNGNQTRPARADAAARPGNRPASEADRGRDRLPVRAAHDHAVRVRVRRHAGHGIADSPPPSFQLAALVDGRLSASARPSHATNRLRTQRLEENRHPNFASQLPN